jgi:hypothetical protein
MAMLASSPPTLLFSASSSNLLPLSTSSTLRLSFSSSLHSSSLSISSTFLSHPSITSSKRFSNHATTFSINASAAVKKKVLIINTNSGGHAVIGFYFAKELLGAGHSVTILTVGDESSDKMKKPPFNRFSVNDLYVILTLILIDMLFSSSTMFFAYLSMPFLHFVSTTLLRTLSSPYYKKILFVF